MRVGVNGDYNLKLHGPGSFEIRGDRPQAGVLVPLPFQKELHWSVFVQYYVFLPSLRTNAAYNIKHNNLINIPYIQREIIYLGPNSRPAFFLGKTFAVGE